MTNLLEITPATDSSPAIYFNSDLGKRGTLSSMEDGGVEFIVFEFEDDEGLHKRRYRPDDIRFQSL